MVRITAQKQCENWRGKRQAAGLQIETPNISNVKAPSKDGVHNESKVDFTSADVLSYKTTEKFENIKS